MAKYESRYQSLGFYVNGELKRFSNGVYNTDDKDAIAVLDTVSDAKCVDEPEAKPAPKAPARKPSAK